MRFFVISIFDEKYKAACSFISKGLFRRQDTLYVSPSAYHWQHSDQGNPGSCAEASCLQHLIFFNKLWIELRDPKECNNFRERKAKTNKSLPHLPTWPLQHRGDHTQAAFVLLRPAECLNAEESDSRWFLWSTDFSKSVASATLIQCWMLLATEMPQMRNYHKCYSRYQEFVSLGSAVNFEVFIIQTVLMVMAVFVLQSVVLKWCASKWKPLEVLHLHRCYKFTTPHSEVCCLINGQEVQTPDVATPLKFSEASTSGWSIYAILLCCCHVLLTLLNKSRMTAALLCLKPQLLRCCLALSCEVSWDCMHEGPFRTAAAGLPFSSLNSSDRVLESQWCPLAETLEQKITSSLSQMLMSFDWSSLLTSEVICITST